MFCFLVKLLSRDHIGETCRISEETQLNSIFIIHIYMCVCVRRSDTESAGRYSRSEVDGASSRGQRKPRINLSRFFGKNKDKVSGADTDTMKTVITIDDEKVQTAEPAAQEGRTSPPTGESGIVYAELDLTQQQQGVAPRRVNEDKTEYAEILYTKPETEETPDK